MDGRPKNLREGPEAIDREFDLYDQDPAAGEHEGRAFRGTAQQISQVLGSRQCAARRRDGERCQKMCAPGMQVCRVHGSNPQARAAARLRLQELAEPAVAKLARLMMTAESEAVQLRATNSILDRIGFARQSVVSIEETQDIVMSRLLEFQARKDEEQAAEHLVIEPSSDDTKPENPASQERTSE